MGEPENVLIDIRERLVRVETKIDAQMDLREKVDAIDTRAIETDARSKSNTHRVDKLEENNTWLWRAFVGAFITSGVGFLFLILKK